ncbi:hypothetical protein ACJJTC_017840 [Scirpophaga incertulas]
MPPIKRKTWDHAAMIQAVNAVRRKEMGYLRAANQFGVPKGTLERYVKKDVRAEDLMKSILESSHRGRALLRSDNASKGILDYSQRKELAHLILDSMLNEDPNVLGHNFRHGQGYW